VVIAAMVILAITTAFIVSFYRAVDSATVDVPGEVGVAANQWVALCAQHGSRQM
jgi:hypothetical protein